MDDPHPTSSRNLWIAIVTTILLGACLLWIDQYLRTPLSPLGIVSLELAKNIFRVSDILNSWGAQGHSWAIWSLALDFPFLLAYSYLFSVLANRTKSDIRQLFMVGFMIAGMCDFIENLALAGLLAGWVYPQLTAAAYYFSCLKFLLLFMGWAFLGSQASLWAWSKLQPEPVASPSRATK